MELDILEKNVLIAISKCSVFSYSQVSNVYTEVKSFDKTIKVLKTSVSTGKSLSEVVRSLNCT
jgi:hypothetical protein